MTGEQPDFAKVEVKKLTWKQGFEEYQRKQDEFERQKKEEVREKFIRDQIALFLLKIDDNEDIPLAFNMITGQVAVREDALGAKPVRYTTADHFCRIRAEDGLHMLKAHQHSYRPVPSFSTPQLDYPPWFFTKSNEPRPDLVKVMRRVRLRTWFGSIGYGIGVGGELVKNLIIGVLGFLLIVALGAIVAYGGFRVLEGLAGLLEFGRRQL